MPRCNERKAEAASGGTAEVLLLGDQGGCEAVAGFHRLQ
jgi:hypothetical protein